MERSNIDYRLIMRWGWTLGDAISLLYGLIVLGIAVFMALITAADLLYINNPTVQSEIKRSIDGRRVGGFRLVSLDAIKAVEESYMTEKQATVEYLKKRIKTYIIATSTLVILATGGDSIISIATNVVEKILGVMGWI